VTRAARRARLAALAPALALPSLSLAACLSITAGHDATPLASVAVPAGQPSFAISYVHSVTQSPVEERYRIDGPTVVQTAILFSEHGPGLPTAADAGGRFGREGDRFIVTMRRPLDAIPMRVHRAQSPTLVVDGRTQDLAAWGNRALTLTAHVADCPRSRRAGA